MVEWKKQTKCSRGTEPDPEPEPDPELVIEDNGELDDWETLED